MGRRSSPEAPSMIGSKHFCGEEKGRKVRELPPEQLQKRRGERLESYHLSELTYRDGMLRLRRDERIVVMASEDHRGEEILA
jgi:hypothetical protein